MIPILPAVLFIWFGLLLGVSFVATPAKFLAPAFPWPRPSMSAGGPFMF